MGRLRRAIATILAVAAAVAVLPIVAVIAFAHDGDSRAVDGTVWVANRGAHTIRGFDAATGNVVATVAMRDGSQPGDLAFANGKLYVAEEFGTPQPAIAIVDPATGSVTKRIFLAAGSRPHHVHASRDGDLVAFGLYGTDTVAVVDTRTDTLLGPWDINPATTNGRAHAAVFSRDDTLYVASDASGELVALDPRTGERFWTMSVPAVHELAIARNGRTAFVSRRTDNMLAVVDLKHQTYEDVLALGLPDTLRLSANGRQLTVGLRTMPAQLAVVDTRTFAYELVRLGPLQDTTTIAGHQWTSRNGRFTFAAYEGGTSPGVAVVDHRAGNAVVNTLGYPGRPHGVDLAPATDDDEGEAAEEEGDD